MLHSNYLELEEIYDATFGSGLKSIAISSINTGEGSSLVAVALSQRALLAGKSVLVVDMNSYRPNFKPLLTEQMIDDIESNNVINAPLFEQNTEFLDNKDSLTINNEIHDETSINTMKMPELLTNATESFALTGVIVPTDTKSIMALRKQDAIEQQINHWFQEYDYVVFDTAPINRISARNIPAQRVIQACEGAVIIALAGSTSEADVMTALSKLKKQKNKIVGWVINDRDNPSLKSEMLRELKRLDPLLGKYTSMLKKMINNSKFLSTSV